MTEKDSSTGFNFDSLTDFHSEIQDNSSDPNVEAIAAHTAKEAERVTAQGSAQQSDSGNHSGDVDSDGTVFNPELHATNAEGEPSITSTGKFRKKKGARKKSTVAQQSAEIQQLKDLQQREQQARAAGKVAADMMIQSSTMLLGPEWQPIQQDGLNERHNLHEAFGNYFVAKDISDFPPGVALTVVCLAYALPRITTGKETQTRLGKAKIWVAEKLNNMKRKRKNASQSNRRDDGERKNDASEATMQTEHERGARHPRT